MKPLRSALASIRPTKKHPHPAAGVPILVRFWEESGVWNASAFDLPIAVFGNTYAEARKNFEGALIAHFDLLIELKRAGIVADQLRKIADEQGFYYERVKPCVTVEKFMYEFSGLEMCV